MPEGRGRGGRGRGRGGRGRAGAMPESKGLAAAGPGGGAPGGHSGALGGLTPPLNPEAGEGGADTSAVCAGAGVGVRSRHAGRVLAEGSRGQREDWAGLPREVLGEVFRRVAQGDGLAVRLTCRAFAEAAAPPGWAWGEVGAGGDGGGRTPRALTRTRVADVAVSLPRMEWGRGLLVGRWKKAKRKVCEWAARAGSLEVLQWARAQGCPWTSPTCTMAAKGGHLEVLQWARAQGCPRDEETCYRAAKGGHLEVLQWARAQGCPWDERTCSEAAYGGHLEVLQWARAQGCPWDEETCSEAANGGHLEVLQWARAQGCPWDNQTCQRAADGGHLDVLHWARAKGCGPPRLSVFLNGVPPLG